MCFRSQLINVEFKWRSNDTGHKTQTLFVAINLLISIYLRMKYPSISNDLFSYMLIIYRNSSIKCREPATFQNLERRIVRGAAYSCLRSTVSGLKFTAFIFSDFFLLYIQDENDFTKREEEIKRRQILRKRQIARNQRGIIGTPPVRGRKHETIQTDKYLEEVKSVDLDFFCIVSIFTSYQFLFKDFPPKASRERNLLSNWSFPSEASSVIIFSIKIRCDFKMIVYVLYI